MMDDSVWSPNRIMQLFREKKEHGVQMLHGNRCILRAKR